ncbi:TerB family tellurite resistance protein [Candidatus Pelagibacter sp.]|nr:TerB family tellurite resistance protein [Candidatus Pelagibacter sp.]
MFFKKKENETIGNDLKKICALLIHAAKIDEDFSDKEEKIIKETMLKIGVRKDDLEKLFIDAKNIEQNANQILSFTKEVKNMNEHNKIKIIEALWYIIYSNNEADIYETNLMRRLAGLLYIDSKVMGDIKEKIKRESSR